MGLINRLQYDIAGTLGNGTRGYIVVGTYDKDAGANNQRLYLNGTRVAQMSDTLPINLNSAALGIGRHVSGMPIPSTATSTSFASPRPVLRRLVWGHERTGAPSTGAIDVTTPYELWGAD